MFWRELESRIWSCGRLGFEHVNMSLILYDMLSNLIDFMDSVKSEILIGHRFLFVFLLNL